MCTFWPDKWIQPSEPVAFLLTLLLTFLLSRMLLFLFSYMPLRLKHGMKNTQLGHLCSKKNKKKSSNSRNISRLSQVVRELNIQIARVFPAFLTGRTICILSSGHMNTLHRRHNPLVSSHQAPAGGTWPIDHWCCSGFFWPPALHHAFFCSTNCGNILIKKKLRQYFLHVFS